MKKPILCTITLILSLLGSSCDQSTPNATVDSSTTAEHYQQLFNDTIECAAIIAVLEQEKSGDLTSDSEAFKWVGYSLGQANNYRSDGKLTTATDSAYKQRVLSLFLELKKQTIQPADLQAKHLRCIENAKTYDPKTQIQTLLERAQRQAQ